MMKNLISVGCVSLTVAAAGGCSTRSSNESATTPNAITITGAGSTFVAPLFRKWFEQYHNDHPGIFIDYQAVGSTSGTKLFLDESVDFGASDAALTDEQITASKDGAVLVPVTAGMIVLAYNPEGMPPSLNLSRDTYADIFLGKLHDWDDPRIVAANPGAKLPAMKITVVARRDGSGTTFALTNHLAAISENWKSGPGVGQKVVWPEHVMLANGNGGVAGDLQRDIGAIGYVEYGIAKKAGLGMAVLENKAGKFIEPTNSSGLDTLIQAKMPANLRLFIPDPDGAESYPIVTYSWLLIRRHYDDQKVSAALRDLIHWCLKEGQTSAEFLGYVRLAPRVVSQAIAAMDANGS